MSEQEKKDKKFSIIMTGLIHGLVALLLFLLVAWSPPDPPIPEYGIELNFGFEEEGGGDTERDIQAKIEETIEQTPSKVKIETAEVQKTQVAEEVPVNEESPITKTVVEPITTATVPTIKVAEKEQEVVEEKKEETAPNQKKKVEEQQKVEQPKPKPTLDSRALMGGRTMGGRTMGGRTTKTKSKAPAPASNNQGENYNKQGNQGNPKGNKNTKGKNPGGAELGYSLNLDGWKWENPPTEKDDSQIDGVIKFAIDVDDRGKVLKVSIKPGTTISDNTIVEFYRKQVMRLSFIQTNTSKTPAPISKGEVTFVIRTS